MQQRKIHEITVPQGAPRFHLGFSEKPKAFIPDCAIKGCTSFRDAVRLAWDNRSNLHLTMRTLAEECGLYPPHITDILHREPIDAKGHKRRELPADKIAAFERVVGNSAVMQYLTRKGDMTLMEEVIASRGA